MTQVSTQVSGDWLTRPGTRGVMRMLERGGHQAWLVGGCVRDALMQREIGDIDITTDAPPDRVTGLAQAAGFRAVPTGLDHGTVTVIAHGIPHEVTTLRRDVATDGRHATVVYATSIEDDARRRDFTMNALYADSAGHVRDPMGGIADIAERHVRFIGDPHDRIAEDYLRILRFFRFHAWFGDPHRGLNAEGYAAAAELGEGVDRLSRERVGAEMKKLLAAPDPGPAVASMAAAGILPRILPGAEDRALGPLVHLEGDIGVMADPLRRLAVLGGVEAADYLRLSRKEERRLTLLRAGIGDEAGTAELAYRHGAEAARDIELLRAASFGAPISATLEEDIANGAAAEFPVKPRDLMPGLQGPALGRRLSELEARWIASGFELSRDALLA
ncbi:CCA tRNA nucleotidyltransferase [Mesobaculum littorinae]|uniref:CCA tRNA nucleotidyltransferase n=1 Tax=Mesobaculum littorinae TaxID=2486419 RepID=A0A438AH84_9RHOB|nr:CCA tRNA nucleotidyltransferase [Mesobaculum littorinae]RVV98038.1 CCA tRNA nucleotidyltransferase [Mesobaculum littorinae]